MKRERLVGIYQIRNLVDGKLYVGSAIDIMNRWSWHECKLEDGGHCNLKLLRAWRKHGPESFIFEIIEYCLKDELIPREQFWIDKLGVYRTISCSIRKAYTFRFRRGASVCSTYNGVVSAMKIIEASCVDEALFRGLTLLENEGLKAPSRNGDVLVMPCPVMTVNNHPMHRVSFNSKRNANPVFHLMEALWMLAGRDDATWLDQFVGDFSKRFAEETGHMHGAYGFRWRKHFDMEGGGAPEMPDQLETAVRLLKANLDDRRVVITMWDPVSDLGADVKDAPCNTHIYCRVRDVSTRADSALMGHRVRDLDLTVCCRSNDEIYGCHGANAVHFSVLQEYLAARIGVGIGKLYQLSNNYHAYTSVMSGVWPMGTEGTTAYALMDPTTIIGHPEEFDRDLELFFSESWAYKYYANGFIHNVAVPLRKSYALWREGKRNEARNAIHQTPVCDWTIAAVNWYHRKMTKHLEKNNVG